jgi:hypothetical protein
VLTHVGWVIQDHNFSEYIEPRRDFEANEAIMKIAASLLGPSAATLEVISATLEALKSMKEDSPWIRLFKRESQSAQSARFQVTLAEERDDGQFLISLMAF